MMSRYLQKISLRPFSNGEMWAGWELEGRSGPIDGLILADAMTADELVRFGVKEFQRIPAEYLEPSEFRARRS